MARVAFLLDEFRRNSRRWTIAAASAVQHRFRRNPRRWAIAGASTVLVLASFLVYTTSHGSTEQARIVSLPGGGRLIIPPDAMADDAKVTARVSGDQPDGQHVGMRLLGQAVELVSDPPNAIHGVLTLELPVPAGDVPEGVDPAVWFGVSTYDETTRSWVPQTATYDAPRHMIVAWIKHFSWWNPFSWDFGSFGDAVAQRFGEAINKRVPAPKCHGGRPAWVDALDGVSADNNVAIRACAQSDGDALDIELANNRPYGQVVQFGNAITRASRDDIPSTVGSILAAVIDATMADDEIYLPPLTRASVTIKRMDPQAAATYHIGPSVLTIGADLAMYLLEPLDIISEIAGAIRKAPDLFKRCVVANGKQRLADRDTGKLWAPALTVFRCIADGLRDAKTTDVPKQKLDRLAAAGELFKRATPALNGIQLTVDFLWQIGDLVADWFANKATSRGNGFEVHAKDVTPAVPAPSATPQPQKPKSWVRCFNPFNWGDCFF